MFAVARAGPSGSFDEISTCYFVGDVNKLARWLAWRVRKVEQLVARCNEKKLTPSCLVVKMRMTLPVYG